MKMSKCVLAVLFVFMSVAMSAVIAAGAEGKTGQGEKLVHQFWSDIAASNIQAIEKYMAPGFQSIHEDGARDRAAEIELIKGLNIKGYSLSNLKVTKTGPVIVVTYFSSVQETIDGKILSSKPAPRLSAWLKTDKGWQLIIHANLKPLQ